MSGEKQTNQIKQTNKQTQNPQTPNKAPEKKSKFTTQLDFRGIQLYETACETRKFILHCLTHIFQLQFSLLPVVLGIL